MRVIERHRSARLGKSLAKLEARGRRVAEFRRSPQGTRLTQAPRLDHIVVGSHTWLRPIALLVRLFVYVFPLRKAAWSTRYRGTSGSLPIREMLAEVCFRSVGVPRLRPNVDLWSRAPQIRSVAMRSVPIQALMRSTARLQLQRKRLLETIAPI